MSAGDAALRRRAMDEAVSVTFADMAFIDVNPVSAAGGEPVEYSHVISISLLSPAAGELSLFFPLECKRKIAENIYAKAWEDLDVQEIDDCLLELLNILAGNFLLRLYGAGTKYNISFPEILFDDSRMERFPDAEEFLYDAEGTRIRILLAAAGPEGE